MLASGSYGFGGTAGIRTEITGGGFGLQTWRRACDPAVHEGDVVSSRICMWPWELPPVEDMNEVGEIEDGGHVVHPLAVTGPATRSSSEGGGFIGIATLGFGRPGPASPPPMLPERR